MSKEVIFINPETNGFILIEEAVLRKMDKYRQQSIRSKEAGGIMLGFRRGPHLEIIDITLPFPLDIRKRAFFYRCDPLHDKYANKLWKKSENTIDYLGEWHTHPELVPIPSVLDKSEWKKVTASQKSEMAFLILGINSIWLGIGNGLSLCATKEVPNKVDDMRSCK